jgi:uncharacterized membrane protein
MTFTLPFLAHVHLLLNHFPTVGFSIGLGLFVLGILAKSDDLKRASFVIFFIIALLLIPTYMTGKAAEQAVVGREGVSEVVISTHQDAALLAFVFMEITGFLAWLGLWQYRRTSRTANWNVPAVLVLSLVTFGLMARAANIGGEIRHPEIMAEGAPAPANNEMLQSTSIAAYINSTNWAWPAVETLHFIGLVLLLGTVLVVNLRMLGVMKNVPFSAVHRLLPWGIIGFGLNVFTGMVFFVTIPEQYVRNIALQWKMVLMLIAAADVLYFTMFEEAWAVKPGDNPPLLAKIVAVSTIILWIGVIWFGRMMPFIGGSF